MQSSALCGRRAARNDILSVWEIHTLCCYYSLSLDSDEVLSLTRTDVHSTLVSVV